MKMIKSEIAEQRRASPASRLTILSCRPKHGGPVGHETSARGAAWGVCVYVDVNFRHAPAARTAAERYA